MWWAGLRGAVAFSVAVRFPAKTGLRDAVVDTTSLLIFFTVFGLGASTHAVLGALGIKTGVAEDTHVTHVRAIQHAVVESSFKRWLYKKNRQIEAYILSPVALASMRADAAAIEDGAVPGAFTDVSASIRF